MTGMASDLSDDKMDLEEKKKCHDIAVWLYTGVDLSKRLGETKIGHMLPVLAKAGLCRQW